jgi:hypothetical protein
MIPAVSVIIPTYNRRAMVREAVASVLAQRDANFELIVWTTARPTELPKCSLKRII